MEGLPKNNRQTQKEEEENNDNCRMEMNEKGMDEPELKSLYGSKKDELMGATQMHHKESPSI